MTQKHNSTVNYIIDFLAGFSVAKTGTIHYGSIETVQSHSKIIIIPTVSDFEIKNLPKIPFAKIDDTPILFGDSKIERGHGKLIIYADIVASSFFLLSRYEELLNTARDQHRRFTAKESIVFRQGYGNRPLVDEYGILLRKWLREVGEDVPPEKNGFSKIYLTHDVDSPFKYEHFKILDVIKIIVKNIIRYKPETTISVKKYFEIYRNEKKDTHYTFPKLIEYDTSLKKSLPSTSIESIYFFITAGSESNKKYYNFFSLKVSRLLDLLQKTGALLGLHISYESGAMPESIQEEAERLRQKVPLDKLLSRHHYLRWHEPEDIVEMENAGITDDFTLSYADCAGFRVGTCHPYRFIHPKTKVLTNVFIHPMEIMDCSLSNPQYMNLNYVEALENCKQLIDKVYKHNGELVLLWHNTEFLGENYQEQLYKSVLNYIGEFSI